MRLLRQMTVDPPNHHLKFPRISSSVSTQPTKTDAYPLIRDPKQTLLDALKRASKTQSNPHQSKLIHSLAIQSGLARDVRIANGLLILYTKHGADHLSLAQKLFDEISDRDTFTYTIMITAHARLGPPALGLRLLSRMLREEGGLRPNRFTLSAALKCCAALQDGERARQIHAWVLRNGVGDVVLGNSIMDSYAKCGWFGRARRVFDSMAGDARDAASWNIMMRACARGRDAAGAVGLFERSPVRDVVSWNTIISGRMRDGFDGDALGLLYRMAETGTGFNGFTFSMALTLVGGLGLVELGTQVHARMLRCVFECDLCLVNSLIDMYCKCGRLREAFVVFERARGSCSSLVLSSTMVAGLTQNGRFDEAFSLFSDMLRGGEVKPNQHMLTSVVSGCADSGTLGLCRQVHARIEKSVCERDVCLECALVDAYAKCGSLEDAHKVFVGASEHNVVLWGSTINAYALHGRGVEAVRLFEEMLRENVRPNEACFVAVLSACSHSGMVEEGRKYFKLMREECKVCASVEHYVCMVDLFGRAGRVEEAKEFICENGLAEVGVVWKALLFACQVRGDREMARWAYEQMVRIRADDDGAYVSFSNVLSSSGQWEEAAEVRALMRGRRVRKRWSWSWLELKEEMREFSGR
ncbi:Pentatricopeptide repeat-containing protein [Acorus gramineus]|uniref:Pentatricopeptide repeat-containing protein n=1 Tax=Acorus gramineus TaxID=55184 RepID=A0AAV9B381_ACOGR|nr:Pentatricopeptide repeat-containing protein [Acorus gramineus]